MWPTFVLVGLVSGFVLASRRQATWWLGGAAVVVVGAFISGEVATAPLILVNLVVGLAFGSLVRFYARFARRLWTAP